MIENEELRREAEAFESIPVRDATSDQRKNIVRTLQKEIQTGNVDLTQAQFQECLTGKFVLGRIVAYLMVESGRGMSTLESRRAHIEAEWERLQFIRFAAGSSTMPLYYSLRAYLNRLKSEPQLVMAATADLELFQQIDAAMIRHGLDPGKQVQGAIKQLRTIFEQGQDPSSNPAVMGASIARGGTIRAALIAGAVAILVALIALVGVLIQHRDKQLENKSVPQVQPAAGAPASPAKR